VTVLRSSNEAIKLAKPVSDVFKLDLIGPSTYAPKCLLTRDILGSAESATFDRREGKLTILVLANRRKLA